MFYIDTIIFQNRAPFSRLKLNFQNKCIALLSSYNGGGKTTILSHVVDAFYEIARPYYDNEFHGIENKYYRVSSSNYIMDVSKPSYVYIRFVFDKEGNGNKKEYIDYLDIRNNCSKEEYEQAIDLPDRIPFESFSKDLKENMYVKCCSKNVTKEVAISIFGSHVLTFFPAYRFEYPNYINDCYKDGIKYKVKGMFSGYLPNKIEVISDIEDLANWMMDVLLDWQVYKETRVIPNDKGLDLQIDVTREKLHIWDVLNDIINKSIVHNDEESLRLGISRRSNSGKRISIIKQDNSNAYPKYPSIFGLSSGEMTILTMFGEVLRQADNLNKTNEVGGIVLIDEIDMHLHIKLQKEVLPKLFGVFPNVQFIISSHSPFLEMGLSESNDKRLLPILLNHGSGYESNLLNNPLYDEVYQMMISENERYKTSFERLLREQSKQKQLLVEDEHDQIYKVAWLKLKDIPFTADNLDEVFNSYSPFEIINGLAAGGVAGCLRVKNPKMFNERTIVGLFDFDKEGSENFYHLKEGFKADHTDIIGDISSGLFRKKETDKSVIMYALLLPVPDRLSFLIARSQNENIWKGNGNFANYVEIETLLPFEYLANCQYSSSENFSGHKYYVAKDDKKDVFWKQLVDQNKEVFSDFVPLFSKLYQLFDLGDFLGNQ